MADNQFIARKGLISLDDSQITGSLSITNAVTASVFTGSFRGDGTNLYNIPSSGVTGLNLDKIISGSVSASISPNNGFRINTDVYIDGTITAKEFHTDYVTSSVLYQSGSTKFGDTLDDLHEFTGSVRITGSITLNGQAIGTGKLDETTFNSYTSSISSSIGGLSSSITTLSSSLSGSIDSLSSSVASINNTQNGRLDSLETASGSIRTDFNTFTSSYTTGSFTGSFIGDGSQLTGIDGFPFTGSAKITGSLAVTGSLTVDGNVNATSFTGSIQGTATTASYVNLTNVDGFTSYSSSVSSSINSVLNATTPVTATVNNTNSPLTITNQTIVIVDSTNGNVTINLPDLNTVVGTPNQRPIIIYKNDYSQNVVFVEPSGSQLVNGTTRDIIASIQIGIVYNPTSAGWVTEGTSYQSLAELELFFVPRTETGSLSVSTASYVEYANVANKPSLVSGSSQISFNGITDKPTLISGSSQITYSGLTGVPSDIVSGSSQIIYSGLTGTPSGIVSSSAQVLNYGIFATTGSNGFNGNQSITGSLTVTGQVVAQTLNVQQVTSSIVYSSGSNIFGNSLSNTQQFTGSLQVSGSSHYLMGNVGIGDTSPQSGLYIAKYGSNWDGDVQYNKPTGNVFLSMGYSVSDQDNWFGIRGNYSSSSGTANILLQANYRDVSSQAGHYITSKATAFGIADFEIGKLVTSTSTSTPPTKVPQLIISSAGNVGIGAPTPGANLHVVRANDGGSGTPGVILSTANGVNDIVRFQDGTTTTAVVKNDGSIFAGSSIGVTLNSLTNRLSVSSTSYNLFDISRFSNNAFGPNFYLVKSRNGSIGGNTIVESGDNLGNIIWVGAGGGESGFTDAASIRAEVDGTPGPSNDMPGRLLFSTTANGAGSTTERMRIDSGGTVQVRSGNELRVYRSDNARYGTFYNDNSNVHIAASVDPIRISSIERTEFYVTGVERMRTTSGGRTLLIGSSSSGWSDTNRALLELNHTGSALLGLRINGDQRAYFYHNNSHLYIENMLAGGSIYVISNSGGVYLTSGGTSWTSNSDERLKNINGEIENAVDKLMTLRTVNYSWKNDETEKENLGLIAQDVEKVFPELIDKNKLPSKPNEEQEDETEYLGVRYQELIPVLVKALQEQQEQIEILKAEIQTLKQ
jgi:hypothetical protein